MIADETQQAEQTQQQTPLGGWLLALGLWLAGVGGAFLPWVADPSPVLQLTAPGLAEFIKFLPEIRLGAMTVQRLWFLLPLIIVMLLLPLIAENGQLRLPTWLRWLLRLSIVPFALASLSPVWTPDILVAAEFRLQTGLAIIALGLTVIAPLLKRLPLWGLVSATIVGGGLAMGLSYVVFGQVQRGLSEAYATPVSLGWGWWVMAGGFVVSFIGGVWAALRDLKSPAR